MVFELSNKDLISKALEREEGVLASNGALTVVTGKRTGRSPLDRYIVEEKTTKHDIEWGEIIGHLMKKSSTLSGQKLTLIWMTKKDF